jgi:hypothetical protein
MDAQAHFLQEVLPLEDSTNSLLEVEFISIFQHIKVLGLQVGILALLKQVITCHLLEWEQLLWNKNMPKITFKIILIILLGSSLFSCRPGKIRLKGTEPIKFFKKDLEKASPDFQQGWADGCESGMSGGSTSFNQNFYKPTQDGYKFTYSPDYKSAWGSSFWFCYRSDSVYQKSKVFNALFRGLN